jgi:hypothetical protein
MGVSTRYVDEEEFNETDMWNVRWQYRQRVSWNFTDTELTFIDYLKR